MRCLACNSALSDKEASRKFTNWREINNTEERYVGLCSYCLETTDINYEEKANANDDKEDETYSDENFPIEI